MGFFNPSELAVTTRMPTLPQCGKCGLFKHCQSPKMPAGLNDSRVLIVGEFPTEKDDESGELFKSYANALNELTDDAIDVNEFNLTNALICHPKHHDEKKIDSWIDNCRPNLTNTIEKLKPRVIILMGHIAIKSLIGLEWGGSIGEADKWAGWQIPSAKFNAWLCPTFSPASLFAQKKNPVFNKIMGGHLRNAVARAKQNARFESIEKLRASVETITSPRLMRMRLRDLVPKRGKLSFDYETTSLKPEPKESEIYTSSFCLNGEDTFAGRIDETCHDALREVLLSKRTDKGGSNIKFEERWSIVKLGIRVRRWKWDTMLAAHYEDNRQGITSVKFQTYRALGIGDYQEWAAPYLKAKTPNSQNRIRKAPLIDLLTYNGMDSLVEYKVGEWQKENLGW